MSQDNHGKVFYCPFCSKDFQARDILFADEDKTASFSVDDPERMENLENRLVPTGEIGIPGTSDYISIEQRPVYKYHRWAKPSNSDLPFMEPESISKNEEADFPEEIRIFRRNGMTPKQLSGQDPAPWAEATVEAPAPQQPTANVTEDDDDMGGWFNMGFSNTTTTVDTTPSSAQTFGDVKKTLTEKACPCCHSILPDNFGELEVYRISMLGGTRSGKTTYMVSAANLLRRQGGLPSNVITSCTISKESARYFDYFIKCLEHNVLAATVLDDSTDVRFVFPIVLNVSSVTDEGDERNFILIINDIPGEAMRSKSFLMNFPGLRHADAAIMLMDPMQFITSSAVKTEIVKNILGLTGSTPEEMDEIEKHMITAFTPYSFGESLNNIKRMITDSKFDNLRSFTLVLNKLDLLYAGSNPFIDDKTAQNLSCIHGIYHLGTLDEYRTQHDDGINEELLRTINGQVVYLIEKKLGFGSYTATIKEIMKKTDVLTLCTSVRNWNEGRSCFCGMEKYNPADSMLGFRMMEPLLRALAQLGLVKTKEGDIPRPDPGEETFRDKIRKFFGRG